jgi:hypothetical protein
MHSDVWIVNIVEEIQTHCKSSENIDNHEWEMLNENIDNCDRESVHCDVWIVKVDDQTWKYYGSLENLDNR